jgi:WD40 repeat protein
LDPTKQKEKKMKKLIRIFCMVAVSTLLCCCCKSPSDSDPPQVNFVFPGHRSITDHPYLTIRGTAQDKSGIKELTIDGRPVTTTDDYANWHITYKITSTGHHYPLIIATDKHNISKFIEFHIHAVQTSRLTDATVGTGVGFSSDLACLAVSLSGDIYILDAGNDAIIAVDPKQGNRSIVADPDTIDGLIFVQPALIAVDNDGTLIAVDGYSSYGYRILRIDLTAGKDQIISFTHSHPGPEMQLPTSIAIGDDGTIYIADFQRRAIFSIDPNSGERRIVSDGTVSPIYYPLVIAVDPDGTLLVSDDGNGRLYRINPENDERTSIDHSLLLPNIEGIAMIDGDSIVISSRAVGVPGKWRISVCDRSGGVCSTLCDENNGNGPKPIDYIACIGTEPEGAIIGLDWHGRRRSVMRIDPESGDRVIISKGPID